MYMFNWIELLAFGIKYKSECVGVRFYVIRVSLSTTGVKLNEGQKFRCCCLLKETCTSLCVYSVLFNNLKISFRLHGSACISNFRHI